MARSLCAGLALLVAVPAQAYDGELVHSWLTRQAATRLLESEPQLCAEIEVFLEEVIAGSVQEDDLFLDGDRDPMTIRVMRHFYRPTDGAGIEWGGQPFESSYSWGAKPNEQNEWDWYDALDHYQSSRFVDAYYALGHVLHLVQDLTVPAHVHNKEHGPPYGDDFENYTLFKTPDPWTSTLPTPAAGEAIPTFNDLAEAWSETAGATFWRSMVSGDLANPEQPQGHIVGMFPNIQWSESSQTWFIDDPPVGDLGTAFLEEMPGWYYFFDIEQAAASDRTNFDPELPRDMQYAANTTGTHMAELLARDLIPLAILNTAGVMKLFAESATVSPPDPPVAVDTNGTLVGGCAAAPGPFAVLITLLLARRRRGRQA